MWRIIFFINILLLFLVTPIYAWNQVGHKVVAQIAYDNLTPNAKKQVDALSAIINQYYPQQNNFVDAAIWADDVKYRAQAAGFNPWHYVNIPINQQRKHRKYYAKNNIILAIMQAQTVLANENANQFEKSLFLRFIEHFVGDIHQPLHAASLYNRQFPKGDKGGTLYLVHYHGEPITLHALWDQCFTLTNQQYPTDQDIAQLAHQLQREFPQQAFKKLLKIDSPQSWAYESHDIAKSKVYQIPFNGKVSHAYEQKGQAICEKRLTLAGYRLAAMLNVLF